MVRKLVRSSIPALSACAAALLLLAQPARATDYYLRGNDKDNQCSFDGTQSPVGWAETSGGEKVSEGPNDPTGVYHVDGYLVRINRENQTSISFAGGELVLDRHQNGSPDGAGVPAINHKMKNDSVTTIPKLRIPTGSRAELRQGGAGSVDNSNKYITGTNWVVEAGAELCFNVGEGPKNGQPDTHRYWTCSATFFGEGLVSAGLGMSETRVYSTMECDPARASGSVTLTGDLSAFGGVLSAGEKGVTYTGARSHEELVANFQLVIGATNAMPQASPGGALLRGAMVVTNGATLSVTCDATSPANRGWTFGSGAVPKLDVASGKTLTIEGPVEGTVGFRKTGAGTLVLNVGGAGEYGTLTLEGEQTVSAAQLVDYVARCEAWIAGTPWIESAALATEPSETSAPFAVEATALGRGAATASLSAIVTPAGGASREVTLATLSAPTNGVFPVGGLSPATSYEVSIVLASAAGAVTNGPHAVTTPVANPVPTATLAVTRVYATAADLEVFVPRFGYGATAISSLVLRYGTDPTDESSWTSTNLVPPAAEGGAVSCRLIGLPTGTTYYATVFAANDLDPAQTFETARQTFTPVTPPLAAEVSTEGGNVTTTILPDGSTVLHFLSDGAFTLAADTAARLLLVGGGGAGGSNCGGGGGAGGMLEIDSETLAAGTYGVTVGSGGQPVSAARGGNGGNTVLSFGGEDKHVAVGGGGGACWSGKTGAAGGSGGGGSQSGAGGAGTAGQGNAGGGTNVSGGGGAGSAGSGGGARGSKAGDGGAGRASDITGEEVWYAGGGGGGGWGDANKGPEGGAGGAGGGGNGARNVYVTTRQAAELADGRNEYAAECGVNGLGGGGGGGNNTTESAPNISYYGRPGGSGTLVVRLAGLPSGGIDESQPFAKVSSVSAALEALRVSAQVRWAGFGSDTVRVLYRVAATEEGLASAPDIVAHESLAAGADASFLATNLPAGERRYVRVFAENSLGIRTESAVFSAFPCGETMTATAEGASRTFDVGRDRVAVFTNSAETMTFTTVQGGYVELLLVGGGGAGGSNIGGGGGGGGFVHLDHVYLEPGLYSVSVGAGGSQPASDQRQGGCGGDSSFSGGSFRVAAHGGGGGGGWSETYRTGLSGGSGGGTSATRNGVPQNPGAAAYPGEAGHAGGKHALQTNLSLGTGGGGAGAPGGIPDYGNGIGGAGGDGLPCSITGEEVWYAGGGGAGQNAGAIAAAGVSLVYTAGLGGRGGGGKGCSTSDNVVDDYECGADGLGGGGGGGGSQDNVSKPARWGAPGGSGTVIVRWKATPVSAARATVGAVTGSNFSALVSGTVELAGAAGATIEMAVSRSGGTFGRWNPIGTLADPGAFSFILSGLSANTEYDYAIRVVSGGTEGEISGAFEGSFKTPVSSSLRLSADPTGAAKTSAGIDSVYTFPTAGVYSVVVAQGGPARLLLVGGGGAGGNRRGGGGGAGGFLEYGSYVLEAGEYVVEVGAGGEPSLERDVPGGNGGPTVLWRVVGSETNQVLVAQGGGGGGCYYLDENHAGLPGNPGGSGGGGGPKNNAGGGASTAVAPELGGAGGSGTTGTTGGGNSAAGGGGGAGGPGGDGVGNDQNAGPNRRQGGAGGAGVSSDITGATRWYAGGGGGGVWYDTNGGYKGIGGSGVGGDGGGYTVEVNLLCTAPLPGEDGTGSGGGGGWAFEKSTIEKEIGAPGGCGTFVLRVPGYSFSGLPDSAIESLEPDPEDATAVRGFVALRSAGTGGSAALSLAYGPEPDSLTFSVPVASGAAAGAYAAAVSGLAPGRTWHFAPVAENSRGVVTGLVVSVALPPASASPAGEGPGGLWQAQRRFADAASMRAAFADPALWSGLGNSNLVSGTLAADSSSATFADPVTGLAFAWAGAPSLFAYRGWIYLEGGKTYVFGARFADCVYLSIDGTVLVSAVGVVQTDQSGTFEAEESGWREIDARVGRTGSSFGPDGDGRTAWSSFGLAFNACGITDPMPDSAWTRILDDGSGSLLRPSRPETRIVSIVSQRAEGGSLALGARVGPGGNAAHAWLVSGAEDAGTASTGAWAHVVDLGEVAASDAATDLAASVAGWGSSVTVARIVLETEGLFAWTEPVTFAGTAAPSVFGAAATGYVSGDRVRVRATVAGGTAPYAATLLLGTDPTILSAAGSVSVASAGEFTVAANGLELGTTYWWRLEVRDARGVVARTEILSFAVPSESRLFDKSDGVSDDYLAANRFTTDQNEVVFGGTLVNLGAGETTVWLLRNQSFDPDGAESTFPSPKTTEPHEGEELVVSAVGRYDLPVSGLDWDADIRWNWAVSNGTSTASWGPTACARDRDSWGNYTTVLDVSDYEWAGGDSGASWTNAASWTPDGLHENFAGFPRRGSGAVFPAGGKAVVSVPDFPTPLRFTRLALDAGADVTFVPDPAASAPSLTLQKEPRMGNTTSTPRDYSFSLGEGSALRFKGEGLSFRFRADPAYRASAANTAIEVANGASVTIGNNSGGGGFTPNVKAGTTLVVTNGATLVVNGYLTASGAGSRIVVDDATLVQTYANNTGSRVYLRGASMGGKAALVLRGANPVFQAGCTFIIDRSGDKLQYVDFEVPEGGWSDAPIRTSPDNPNAFGYGSDLSEAGRRILLRVPTNCPAALAGETLDVPLVRWPRGIYTNAVELSSDNLPHPATDFFYLASDTATGQTILMAHLVGWADTDEPQFDDVRLSAMATGSATVSFTAIPGRDGGAFLQTTVSATVLDAAGEPAAGVSAVPDPGSFSGAGAGTVSLSGLAENASYTLRLTLSDGTHESVSADFAFLSAGDYGLGESATADSTVEDGPFTVWIFTNAAASAQSLTVTKAGWADVLVVGGGGSGGGGSWWNCGGGGGGGGQVVATNLFLLPVTYDVAVGAGGAAPAGVREQPGVKGERSGFAGIDAAGGGYGSSNNQGAGGTGASGGGGSGTSKNGGSATAGFPGGKGATAGGGGGGAGGAGANASGIVGGDGGAGYESDISGERLVYGAGGGGGAGQGSGTVGGAPGGPTAGAGAAFVTSVWSDPAKVATMAGAPGFGGGGGGGTSSNSETVQSVGAMRGGAGGCGTVIVRMRTATAHDPVPQAALKSAEADVASVDLTLSVFTLGEGAARAAVTLRVAEAGSAATNVFEMGFVESPGWTNYVVKGLRPATSYAGVVRLENGLEGGVLNLPVAFVTEPESNDFLARSAGAWENTGTWFTDIPPFEDNLLRAATYSVGGKPKWEGKKDYLSDGAFTTQNNGLGLGSGNTVTWTFAEPSDVIRLRVYAYWPDNNWMKIAIQSVSFQDESGEWTTLEDSGTDHSNGDTTQSAQFSATEPGTVLFARATGVRIAFAKNPSKDGTIYHEFEAFAPEADEFPPDLSVLSATRTATRLAASVAFSKALPAAAAVTAYLAADYGAEDLSAWTPAATTNVAAGAISQNFAIPAGGLDGMVYLRFRYVDANGVSRWSESVYLPDIPEVASLPPVVAWAATVATAPDGATLAANLVDAGTGAVGGAANLYVRCALRTNAVDGAELLPFAAAAPEGETTASVSGLLPSRTYHARFVAVNAEGGDAGTGVSDLFSFETVPEAFADPPVSAANRWETGTWTAESIVLQDNLLRRKSPVIEAYGTGSGANWAELTDGMIGTDSGTGPGRGSVLRFELGGSYALSEFRIYTQWTDNRATITVASLEWRDEDGVWHTIPDSAVNYGTSNNRYYAILRPADGDEYLAVGATAFRYTQGTGGYNGYHPTREMELFGVPVAEAGRVLDVTDRSWSGGTLSATVVRPVATASGTIWAASAAGYHGTNATAWAVDGAVASFGSALPAGATDATGSVTPVSGARYVRFFEKDASGKIVAWSPAVSADPAAVAIADLGVVHAGDGAVATARIDATGAGGLSLVLEYGREPDLSDATATNVTDAVSGGRAAVFFRTVPGETHYYRFVATADGGAYDATPVASFTTLAGSSLRSATTASGLAHHSVSLNGFLDVLGAGETAVELWTGSSPDALERFDSKPLDYVGAFSFAETFPGAPHQVWYAFRSVNEGLGGTVWESWSATNSFATVDQATYTWNAVFAEGDWDDPGKWIVSGIADPADCIGFPSNASATVVFEANTVAKVHVDGSYEFGPMSTARNYVDVTFVGQGPDVSGLKGDFSGDGVKGATWTFSALAFEEKNGITFGGGSDKKSVNSTLRFTDGTVATSGWGQDGSITVYGSNMWIVVDGGASLAFSRSGNGFRNGGRDGGLRFDGGSVSGSIVRTDYNWTDTTNQWFLVSGAGPRIDVSSSFRNESDSTANLQNADTFFRFSVPEAGWSRAPIYSIVASEKFAALKGAGGGRYVFSVDPKSPMLNTGRTRTVPIVAWINGVVAANVVFEDEPPPGVEFVFTYGWPSKRKKDPRAGEIPTGIAAVLRGHGGSILILR